MTDAAVAMTDGPASVDGVAVSLEHSPKYRETKIAEGFNATVGKPFRKDDLTGLLSSLRNTAPA